MDKKNIILTLVLLLAWPMAQNAVGWEWQIAFGPWTLEPWTSPAARAAENMVNDETRRLLAPLLSEFTLFSFSPRITMNSSGFFLSAGCWRRLRNDRLALGFSASYLDFSLPFTVIEQHDIYFQGTPVARIDISGEGKIDLRTIMLTAQGRWRIFQAGRASIYAALGFTVLSFSGDLFLPLTASIESILGSAELAEVENRTLAELRAENDDIPAWIVSPSLSLSLHYRLTGRSRLFIDISLSQGTFLSAGLSLGR